MKIGLAYDAFFGSFKEFFPELELINLKKKLDYDLIIFSGGEDINPALYGQPNKSSSYSDNRDAIEKNVFFNATDRNIRILGVCRGHQLINAILGGSLIQDLYTVGVPHRGQHGFDFNKQDWIPDMVNSMHHQGVIQAGKYMNIVATHGGVIEATASNRIVSVQWHPEFMGDTNFFNFIKAWVKEEEFRVDINPTKVITPKSFMLYSNSYINRPNKDNDLVYVSPFPRDSDSNNYGEAHLSQDIPDEVVHNEVFNNLTNDPY